MPLNEPRKHLAEMLLELKLHGKDDSFREKHLISQDISSITAILFDSRYSKITKIKTYTNWLETPPNQPCIFGRVAAKNRNVFVCLLEEDEILRMPNGDEDLQSLIQDFRQVWKRRALDGLSSSFVILLVSKCLVSKEPSDRLKEICRRLMELYMQISPIADNTYETQREYVFLRQKDLQGKTRLLKFSTLPNIFCAQGDGRWWHDHRTPGGIMITSNALGHFIYSRSKKYDLDDTQKLSALENAMRTIGNAYHGSPRFGAPRLRHWPATFLVKPATGTISPLKATSDFAAFSCDHYQGHFHTDHLIPSVFFQKAQDPAHLDLYDNLTFRYIYDAGADPQEHAELMTGIPTTWYEVKRDMDRLPTFVDPEKVGDLTPRLRLRLAKWLEERKTKLMGDS